MALIELSSTTNTSVNPKTNVRYVYRTTTYLNDETNEKIRKRKCIGKIDPETGTVVKNREPIPVIFGDNNEEAKGTDYQKQIADMRMEANRKAEADKRIRQQLLEALRNTDSKLEELVREAKLEQTKIRALLRKYGQS